MDARPDEADSSENSDMPTSALRALIELFVEPGAQCLEICYADRKIAGPWLHERGYRHINVDVSEKSTLPFDDESFDAALMIETLEHLVAPDLAAAEVRRVLRPGGVLIVAAQNVSYWRHRLGPAMPGRDHHPPSFNPGSLRRVLLQAGFNLVGVEGQDGAIIRDLPLARLFWKGRSSAFYRVAERLFPSLLGLRVGAFAIKA